MDWDSGQYLKFADLRLRPAVELLARVPLEEPAVAVDLGCGPGNVTALMHRRWPRATLIGIDSSPDMLARAAADAALDGVQFLQADIAAWAPTQPIDLILSNAALHWLDDHDGLFARLIGLLRPGGVLAVQMPRNFEAPSHRLMYECARGPDWADKLAGGRELSVDPPEAYYDRLSPHCARLDIWQTEYQQILHGPDPVLEWVRGTALRPILAALDDAERARFEAEYAAKLRQAYPARADGASLFAFRRLFIVAVRGAAAG